MIEIEQAVLNFKKLIEDAILRGGNKAKTAMIRSFLPILNIHEAVKTQLIQNGINPELIHPPLHKRTLELKLTGFLKQKNQDVCVSPTSPKPNKEVLQTGLLQNIVDNYGEEFTKRTLTINIRSQISSIQKNFDTLYERTVSEAQNLHERCPEMVLGEVYMIAIPEYNDKEFGNNKIAFKKISSRLVEKYIKSFQAVTDRKDTSKNFYRYETTCLLIVDFNRPVPKIYHSKEELKDDYLLDPNSVTTFEGLEWNNFSSKLIQTYETRFGKGLIKELSS